MKNSPAEKTETDQTETDQTRASSSTPMSGVNTIKPGSFVSYIPPEGPIALPTIPTGPITLKAPEFHVESTPEEVIEEFKRAIFQLIHNFKSHLHVAMIHIKLSKEMIHRGQIDRDTLNNMLNDAYDATGQIQEITNQILAVCASKNGALTINLKPTNIVDLINNVVDKYGKGKVYPTSSILEPLLMDIDPVHFEQVLVNLISNALKYGKFAIINIDQDEEFLIIEIKDRGPGFPPEIRPPFQMFERGEDVKNKYVQGTGIGLAYCEAIVNEHEGILTAENYKSEETGKIQGAILKIKIPLSRQTNNSSLFPPRP